MAPNLGLGAAVLLWLGCPAVADQCQTYTNWFQVYAQNKAAGAPSETTVYSGTNIDFSYTTNGSNPMGFHAVKIYSIPEGENRTSLFQKITEDPMEMVTGSKAINEGAMSLPDEQGELVINFSYTFSTPGDYLAFCNLNLGSLILMDCLTPGDKQKCMEEWRTCGDLFANGTTMSPDVCDLRKVPFYAMLPTMGLKWEELRPTPWEVFTTGPFTHWFLSKHYMYVRVLHVPCDPAKLTTRLLKKEYKQQGGCKKQP